MCAYSFLVDRMTNKKKIDYFELTIAIITVIAGIAVTILSSGLFAMGFNIILVVSGVIAIILGLLLMAETIQNNANQIDGVDIK